ncbi:hypothetical protein DFS34DRAFT_616615 [Phlyctochytrium arcticum]|nr:hypothetical protein DFS34DRAFT_616615 [Phlyctochytrium arcticum]
MGTPHGRGASTPRKVSPLASPARTHPYARSPRAVVSGGVPNLSDMAVSPTRPAPVTLMRTNSTGSIIDSITGLFSGVKETASWGVSRLFRSVGQPKTQAQRIRRSTTTTLQSPSSRLPSRFNKLASSSAPPLTPTRLRPQNAGIMKRRAAASSTTRLNDRDARRALQVLMEQEDSSEESEEAVVKDQTIAKGPECVERAGDKQNLDDDLPDIPKGSQAASSTVSTTSSDSSAAMRIAILERKIQELEAAFEQKMTQALSSIPAAPPPPPPPPPPFKPQLTRKTLVPPRTPPPRRGHDPRNLTPSKRMMNSLMDEMKTVQLKRTNIPKSPNGTLLVPTKDPLNEDCHSIIARELRRKFANVNYPERIDRDLKKKRDSDDETFVEVVTSDPRCEIGGLVGADEWSDS